MIWCYQGMKNAVYFKGAVHSFLLNLHKPDVENNDIPTTGLSFYLRLIVGLVIV